jgi:hypothetical protein
VVKEYPVLIIYSNNKPEVWQNEEFAEFVRQKGMKVHFNGEDRVFTEEELEQFIVDNQAICTSIKFEGLDYESTESITMIGNTKVWESTSPVDRLPVETESTYIENKEITLENVLNGYPIMYQLAKTRREHE